ncbi:MAG: SDH family Clp fold serine proteinase [Thermoplasmatota archaeon]
MVDLLTFVAIAILIIVVGAIALPRIDLWRRTQYRQRLLQAIGARHENARVFAIIHGKGRLGFLGTGPDAALDMEDAEAMLRFLRSAGTRPVDIILHTPGGMYLAAVQMARALREHPGHTRVLVPYYAMSGGTLIALAAKEIIMAPPAVLGPVDPQVGDFLRGRHSVASWTRITREKGSAADDLSIAYGDVSEKLLKESRAVVMGLVAGRVADPAIVADRLVSGTMSHGAPLGVGELRGLGLPVQRDLPPEVIAFLDTFAKARPGMTA